MKGKESFRLLISFHITDNRINNIEDLEKPINFPKSSKKNFENLLEDRGYSKSSITSYYYGK